MSTSDDAAIAAYRKEGYTAVQIGQIFKVNEKTIRRTDGWKSYQTYTAAADKTDKTDTKGHNHDIDIDIEKEKDIDKEKRHIDTFTSGDELQRFKVSGGIVIWDSEEGE